MNRILEIENILSKLKTLNLTAGQIKKISKMYTDDLIDYLIIKISDLYINKNASLEIVLEDFSQIVNLNKSKYPSVKSLNERLSWLSAMELINLKVGLHESHVMITKIFNELNLVLNKYGVEYYHTGGILAYLLTKTPFERFHHDIDVFIEETKFDELKSALQGSSFILSTYIGKRDSTTNRLVIKLVHKNYPDIPISIFLFERLKDHSIIEKDYYYDKNENKFVEERYNCPLSSELSFDRVIHYYNGVPYTSISLEALFVCKQGTRPKDLYDRKIMEPFVDKKKVALIESSLKNNSIRQRKINEYSDTNCKIRCLKKEGV